MPRIKELDKLIEERHNCLRRADQIHKIVMDQLSKYSKRSKIVKEYQKELET